MSRPPQAFWHVAPVCSCSTQAWELPLGSSSRELVVHRRVEVRTHHLGTP